MKKKFLAACATAVFAAAAPLLVLAESAKAHTISQDYCDRSLRGQTGQAPDNDIRRKMTEFESIYTSWTFYSATPKRYQYIVANHWLRMFYEYSGNHGVFGTIQHDCWVEAPNGSIYTTDVAGQTYHDS